MSNDVVEICWPWRVQLNPEGGGLMLCVDRGIPCEGHTQVVSAHVSNTPSMATVRAVVQEKKKELVEQIDAFVRLSHVLYNEWPLKDAIGLLFMHNLVGRIAREAEKREMT